MYMIAEVLQYVAVASFAEAWIEIVKESENNEVLCVASFAEAWIEISLTFLCLTYPMSPPSRRRGLK